jgi:hypothetical protein
LAYRLEGRTLRFDPIAELQPRETRQITLKFRANQDGTAIFRANVASQELPQGVEKQAVIEIYTNR